MTVSLLQLSDPHLLANPSGWYRGVQPFVNFKRGLQMALSQIPRPPDLLLLTGDLCQDESWAGYGMLRDVLEAFALPTALLAGNHDHPQLLRCCLARTAQVAPALISLGEWNLLILDSHWPGAVDGWVSQSQLQWATTALSKQKPALCKQKNPLIVALHHPPEDQREGEALLTALADLAPLKIVLMGHIHQHRRNLWAETVLLGCPSSLIQFNPTQMCPLGLPHQCGGRFLELEGDGSWRETLLRWPN